MNHEVLVTDQHIVNLLFLEDDDVDYQSIARHLVDCPTKFEVSRAVTLEDARSRLARQRYDLILTDLSLPDSDGLDTVSTLSQHAEGAVVMVMTGRQDDDLEQQIISQGAHSYFVKNEIEGRSVARAIQQCLRYEKNIRQHHSLVEHLKTQQSSLESFSRKLNEENRLLRNVHELRHSEEATSHEHLANHLSKEAIAILAVEAEQASRAKSEFLSTVCHELRTTLQGVLSLHDHLSQTPLTDQQRAFVDSSLGNVATLSKMVGEMAEIARIESGRGSVQDFPCDLEAIVEEVACSAQPLLVNKQIELKWSCDETFGQSVLCDGKTVRQILVLLLSNAIKFTSQGRIEIQGATLSRDANGARVRIAVADTGVGVPANTLDDLQNAFSQGSLRQMPPLLQPSLGLSLALQLTRQLGGEMGVNSERWKGSCFWFDLPVRLPEQHVENRLDAGSQAILKGPRFLRRRNGNGQPKPTPRHVLVAHQSRSLQLYLVEQLRQLGYSADTAKDGSDVMYLLGKKRFDLLMIDCHLPVHDVFVIANRMNGVIALHDENQPPPRVLAISDRLMIDNLEASPTENIDAFLTVPLDIARLRETIEQCLEVPT